MSEHVDVAVAGAGAAGLMAAIFAGRAGARVVALDGAPKIGTKILISGGGRCNVTHDVVTPDDFNGSRNAIARVLRTFDVDATVAFFAELGVRLKREETGKLFPVSDRARDVVDALLRAAAEANVEIRTHSRIDSVRHHDSLFSLGGLTAASVVLATGGRSVPKTGSDGSGYALARSLGHTVTETFPALVPLVTAEGHWTTHLSGTAFEAELSVRSATGRVLRRERGSMLLTHFGFSGPVVLDVSRHWLAAREKHKAVLVANFLPGESFESLERALLDEAKRNPRASAAGFLRGRLPERIALAVAPQTPLAKMTREERRTFIRALTEQPLPVVRDRGFDYAEVTAGGVPLTEVDVDTMASRRCSGLFLCGELLDVDGRIGGYNFQWAWSSGRLAGLNSARHSQG